MREMRGIVPFNGGQTLTLTRVITDQGVSY